MRIPQSYSTVLEAPFENKVGYCRSPSWAGVIMNSRAEKVPLQIQLFSKLNTCMLQFDDASCNHRVVTVKNNLFILHIFL